MRQKLTLLKDLPDYPAGTVFYIKDIRRSYACEDGPFYEVSVPDEIPNSGRRILKYYRVGNSIIDDPTWFRREIDHEHLVNLRCPLCGETHGEFFSTSYYRRNMDSDDYGVQYGIGFECLCGHKRILYGTRYGNKKLREEMELDRKTQQLVKEALKK